MTMSPGDDGAPPFQVCFSLWDKASAEPSHLALRHAGLLVVTDDSLPHRFSSDVLVVKSSWTPRNGSLELISEAVGSSTCLVLAVADTTDELHCILCLEAGAHAFLHGPFTPRLLIAVIQSLVRCRERPSWAQPTALCFGGLRLEPGRSSLCFSGREVSLSMAELAIMTLLMSEPSRTFSREELAYRDIQRISGARDEGTGRPHHPSATEDRSSGDQLLPPLCGAG